MMLILSTRLVKSISTKRFFQIMVQSKTELFPDILEQSILSRYLNQEHRTFESYHTKNVEKKSNLQKQKAQGKKNIPNYQQYLNGSPQGVILHENYKNISLNLISLSSQEIILTDLYKVYKDIDPDIILLQTRPENYIPDFNLLPKSAGSFSDLKYMSSLILKGEDIDNLVLTPDTTEKLQEIVSESKQKSGQSGKKVIVKEIYGIVQSPLVLLTSFYAKKHGKDLLLGEIPSQVYREWICNSHTLMEMQEMFSNICKNMPFYQSLNFSPFKMGTIIYPEIFLTINDKYMATLIEMLIANNQHKKILGVFGIMEAEAVSDILKNEMTLRKDQHSGEEEFMPMIEFLIPQGPKGSLLKNIEGWQIIEKHLIFDILENGMTVGMKKLSEFKTTNRVCSYYGQDMFHYQTNQIARFRFDRTVIYLGKLKQCFEDGEKMKEKIMMREALRNQ